MSKRFIFWSLFLFVLVFQAVTTEYLKSTYLQRTPTLEGVVGAFVGDFVVVFVIWLLYRAR